METRQKLDMSLDELIAIHRRPQPPRNRGAPPSTAHHGASIEHRRLHRNSDSMQHHNQRGAAMGPHATDAAPYNGMMHRPPPPRVNGRPPAPMGRIEETLTIVVTGVKDVSVQAVHKAVSVCGAVKSIIQQDKNSMLIEFDKATVDPLKLNELDTSEVEGSRLLIRSISDPKFISVKRKAASQYDDARKRRNAPVYSNLTYVANRDDNSSPSTASPSKAANLRSNQTLKGSGASVLVTNVPPELTAQEVQDAFSVVGTVIKTEVLLNSSGSNTGRVAINFEDEKAAIDAVRRFDGGTLNSRTIRVFQEC